MCETLTKVLLEDDNFALLIIIIANLARTKCSTQRSGIHRTTTIIIIETNQILLILHECM
jgi:hypothetical protein